MKILKCSHCGNVTFVLHDAGVPMMCCGEPMQALVPGSTDAAQEKHVPAVTLEGSTLTAAVGSVPHPMLQEHYIEWVALHQGDRVQFVKLHPGEEPKATFVAEEGKPYTVYEYCNLHGLWKTEGQA